MGCPSFSFAPVEDDTDIAPILKVSAQFFVQVQTSADYYEEEHAYALVGRMVTAGERARNHGLDGNLKRVWWESMDTFGYGLGRPRVHGCHKSCAKALVRPRLSGGTLQTTTAVAKVVVCAATGRAAAARPYTRRDSLSRVTMKPLDALDQAQAPAAAPCASMTATSGHHNELKPYPQRPCRDFCALQHVLFRGFSLATWLPEGSDPTDPRNGELELFQTLAD